MRSKQEIDRIARARSDGHIFNDRDSCPCFSDKGRAALLAIVFGGAVALTTGCSSPGGGVTAGLIAPVINTQSGSVIENDGFYQPPRSPGFNDLTGS